ncbi:sulfotransferase [Tropicibacter sp. R15_0]|uniref:tetratricopeptide repeat-containing sulfotransferase family protein n=1 Tax=Tropicibacter sp. R15_0 TaxID=2821101 RepID=UPI001ADA2C55|nr:sulfotransferase [Tropicibacter sp. R15_0]MBO9467961.1 sulfotransferase [Tropicibacter sp. R15_0]
MNTEQVDHEKAELDRVNGEIRRIIQHQEAGRYDQAGALIEELRFQYPDETRLIHLAGLNNLGRGNTDEGVEQLEMVMALNKDDVQAKVDYGSHLAQNGNLDKAIELFREAVEKAPNFGVAHANLGAALVIQEKYGAAIDHLKKAIELDGSILDLHLNLAQAYMRTNQFDASSEALYKALSVDPQSAAAHSNLAHMLFRRERHDAAEHHARRAIELNPEVPEPYLHLGNILTSAGRMDEAAETYLKIAHQPPIGVMATARLINMRKVTQDSPELKILLAYLAQIDSMGEMQKNQVHFAMAKASDDLGDYAKAMEHFHKGNAITKEMHPFNAELLQQRAARMQEILTPELVQRCSSSAIDDVAPIFVCGLPRSGTTLMDQMFSRHPKAMAGGELMAAMRSVGQNDRLRKALESEIDLGELTPDDFARLGEDYVAHIHREGLRAEYVSDKMPGNYMFAGLMAMALPRARVLIMRRHPLDCLLSNYMQNFGQNQPFSTNFSDMAKVYKVFDGMANFLTELLPDQVRQVAYEDIVADTEGQMRGILDFIGLEWDETILDHTASSRQVNTASVAQVRQPVYSTAVARWRRYGPLLQDLASELSDHLSAEDLEACGVKLAS